jgi:hypothetical protein
MFPPPVRNLKYNIVDTIGFYESVGFRRYPQGLGTGSCDTLLWWDIATIGGRASYLIGRTVTLGTEPQRRDTCSCLFGRQFRPITFTENGRIP